MTTAGARCPDCGGSVLPKLVQLGDGFETVHQCVQCSREPDAHRPAPPRKKPGTPVGARWGRAP